MQPRLLGAVEEKLVNIFNLYEKAPGLLEELYVS